VTNHRATLPAPRFITFEGIDGAGKSTQLAALAGLLAARGIVVEQTREPGGTPLGEALRALVLHQAMDLETEALLMFAARREHLAQRIRPALAAGRWVVCDRFSDATYAYQVGGRGLAEDKFRTLEAWVHPGFQPDVTFLFDLPAEAAAARLAAGTSAPDRFEREQGSFFERVRKAYLARAAAHPGRFRVLAADRPPEAIAADIAAEVDSWFR